MNGKTAEQNPASIKKVVVLTIIGQKSGIETSLRNIRRWQHRLKGDRE